MNVIEVRPSRRLVLFLAGGHALAAFSCLFLPQGWQAWTGLGLVAVSLFCALRKTPGASSLIGLGDDGGLRLAPGLVADEGAVVIRPATVVSGAAVWLAWREAQGGRSGVLLLLRDQMTPGEWREFQVWLRLRVAGVMKALGDS
ncbi:protein YgfX [Zoogloea sp.]|uniref:protein YgfX n=1 Tax=Zoogloea sp. TaxID=49181 RepID=UPI00345A05EF